MSPEGITAIVTGVLALVGSITALTTSKINAQNSATKDELADLRRRVDDLKTDLLEERDSNDKLRAQITAAEDSVVTAAKEKRELKLQLDEVKADRDKQVRHLQSTIDKYEARIKELECKVRELEILLLGKQNGSDCAGLEKP